MSNPDPMLLDEPDWNELLPDDADKASARGHWDEVVAELLAQNKLATVNGHAISRLVVARVIYEQMARRILKDGPIIQAPKTKVPMQHPALSILSKYGDICAALESELTLSPRKRSTGGKVAPKKADKPGGAHIL